MVRIPASKTAVPELPHWFVPRPWLWRRLADARDAQLVAVIAPAGSGKTTLLAEWARHDPGTPTAWVTVDPEDEDPWRLRSAVLAALVATGSLPPDHPVHRRPPDAGPARDGEDPTDDLLETLDALRPPVRLVLDDVHALTGAPAGVGFLDRLLRRRPVGVRVVVGARSDPPLALPRLRMDGRLAELRADRLRFGVDDAAALLAASGVGLDPAEVAVVHRRSEGWAAGLRLAAIALRSSSDPGGVLARFDGDEQSVADYLAGEVLAALPTATRALLQDVSVCDHLPLALSETLTGRPDAAHALDELADGAAMVERVAPTEYRLHGLLRSHLAADLARHRPARHRQLHATAARWWAERDEPAHALRHAEHAEDPQLTAELVRRAGIPLLLAGDTAPVRHALAVLGPQGPREDPRLALTAALTHLEDGALSAAGLLAAGLGVTTDRAGDRPAPDPVEPELAALIHTGRAAAALGAGRDGDTVVARVQVRRAVTLARAHGFHRLEVSALTLRAIAAVMDGDLGAVVATAGEARAAAARSGSHPAGRTALVTALAAYADLVRGEPERALGVCAEVLAAGDPLPPEAAYAVHVVRASALADRGRGGHPTDGPSAARTALGPLALPEPVVGDLAVLEHRAALRLGDHRAAGEVLDWLRARTGPTVEVLLMRAWAAAASGRHEAAGALAASLRGTGVRPRARHLVEVHLLEAEGALWAGDTAAGRAALDAAFAEGRPLGLVRPFAEAGPRSRAELAARAGGPGTPYGERIRAACAGAVDDVVPLSEREQVVLTLLPSLLNAPAMAEELVVSVNTVRTQIRSIYAKLGVSTRRDAVARANERGLLV